MKQFTTYAEFLESDYKNWVPSYFEQHNAEPSQELLDSPCVLFAYTDYGGDFFDRASCKFLQEFADQDSLCFTKTIFFGENVLYIGKLPDWDSYLLQDFPGISQDFESYYSDLEYEAERESFQFFVDDIFGKRERLKEWAMDQLLEHRSGYYSPQADGTIDFCSSDLESWLLAQPRK